MSILLYMYILSIVILFVYGIHRIQMIYQAKSHHPQKIESCKYQPVLVQLPLFNEANVVEELLDTICALDWPTDLLFIQVLDDSTDETQSIAKNRVKIWQRKGIQIEYIHRSNRIGFKAGALQAGMNRNNIEWIAIFDADFRPHSNFLQQTTPYLNEPQIGMVQARWEHINRHENLLTELSAILLDGHFMIEHTARHQAQCFFNFNGTAGIWKRQCIIESGGWSHDTITEDLDLSYRAQLQGWKFKYLPNVVAPAEVPAQIDAFKSQQFRWAKGSIQTAKKLMTNLLMSNHPFHVKREAVLHLCANIGYPSGLCWILISPWIIIHFTGWIGSVTTVLLFVGLSGVIFFYAYTIYRSKKHFSIKYLLLTIALGIGMSVNQTKAFIEGILPTKSVFYRTPKSGNKTNKVYRVKRSPIRFVEQGLILYCLGAIIVLLHNGHFTPIPLLLLFMWGLSLVSGFIHNPILMPKPRTTINRRGVPPKM